MQAEEYLTPSVAKAIAQVAADAGRAIMEIYEQPETWCIEVKGDSSPLTQADLRANDIILAALSRVAPEVPVLSEESPWTGGDVATYWAVDPLDGTKEFLKRNGEFTVNIALVVEGVARLGVVCAPALKMLWVAIVRGVSSGSEVNWAARTNLNSLDTLSVGGCTWEEISVSRSAFVRLKKARSVKNFSASVVQATSAPRLRMIGSRSHGGDDYPAWVKPFVNGAILVQRGSSLKFCLIAQGDADIYLRMGPTCVWDTAAGQAILVAAGGQVVHADTRQELTYADLSKTVNPSFVASVPGLVSSRNVDAVPQISS